MHFGRRPLALSRQMRQTVGAILLTQNRSPLWQETQVDQEYEAGY
jgi:hypothetical protein